MGYVIYMTVKLFWWLLVAMVWCSWALLVIGIVAIVSLTGHDRAAKQWSRTLNWRRMF